MAQRKRVAAFIFAAACTGSARLSGEIGLPLVHIAVTRNRAESILRLNEVAHGSGVRWPACLLPIRFEDGWDDWAAFPLGGAGPEDSRPFGVRCVDGCIGVTLPDASVLADFEAELAGTLRHLRLQEAVIRPAYLEACTARDPDADVCVHPRYTPTVPHDFRGTTLVTDLFAFDPAEDIDRLVWLAAAAAFAACAGDRTP